MKRDLILNCMNMMKKSKQHKTPPQKKEEDLINNQIWSNLNQYICAWRLWLRSGNQPSSLREQKPKQLDLWLS